MTRPIALDASVLIAAMNPGDSHHRRALTLLRKGAIAGGLIAHTITIAESAAGAAAHGSLDVLRAAYTALGIGSADSDPDEPWRLAQLRASTRLPLPDCCVIDLAQQADADLATFDKRLALAASGQGVGLAPE